jgi:hypothetical protein
MHDVNTTASGPGFAEISTTFCGVFAMVEQLTIVATAITATMNEQLASYISIVCLSAMSHIVGQRRTGSCCVPLPDEVQLANIGPSRCPVTCFRPICVLSRHILVVNTKSRVFFTLRKISNHGFLRMVGNFNHFFPWLLRGPCRPFLPATWTMGKYTQAQEMVYPPACHRCDLQTRATWS